MTAQRLIEGVEGAEATIARERTEDFDWAELERLMGEAELPNEYERLALAMRRILRWIIGSENVGEAGHAGRKDLIAGRVVGLIWVLDPEMFNERPSLRRLADQFELSKSSLSRAAARATADFNLMNRDQIEIRRRTHREPSPEEIRRN